MAVAVEAATSGFSNTSTNTSLTYALTVTAGTALVIGVALKQGNTVSALTYAGVAATQLDAFTNGSDVHVEMWGLLAPPGGANNVVVTHSAGGSNGRVVSGAVSLTGTDTTTPFSVPVRASGTGTAPSATVSGGPSDLVIDALAASGSSVGTETATVGGSQTQRWNTITANGGSTVTLLGAGSSRPSGASVASSWTLNNSVAWAQLAVNVAAPTVYIPRVLSPRATYC